MPYGLTGVPTGVGGWVKEASGRRELRRGLAVGSRGHVDGVEVWATTSVLMLT